MVELEPNRTSAIVSAFVEHWSVFGGYPGAELHDEHGISWFESPIAHLPYNGVIRTAVPDDADADAAIAHVAGRFPASGVPFMWVVRPSDRPEDLGRRLAAHGLDLVEQATGMDLDLAHWVPDVSHHGVRIVEASDDAALADYEALIRTYWSVPEASRHLIERLNRHWSGARSPGVRLVAYDRDRPVGKLFLRLTQLPVVSVYGVAVLPEARGRGVGTGLMNEALRRAVSAGATVAVLHSSAIAQSMYRRMGFEGRCTFHVYATGPLFGTHHH